MLFHIGNHIAHGVEIFDLLIRDLDPELVRQGSDHIDHIQAVCAKIIDNIAFGGDFFSLDVKLVSQIIADALKNFGFHSFYSLPVSISYFCHAGISTQGTHIQNVIVLLYRICTALSSFPATFLSVSFHIPVRRCSGML